MTNFRSLLMFAAVPAVLLCMAVGNGYDAGRIHHIGGPALDEGTPAEVAPDASAAPPTTDSASPEESPQESGRAASEGEDAQQDTPSKDEPNPLDAEQAPEAEGDLEADTVSAPQKQAEGSDAEPTDGPEIPRFDREQLRRQLREKKRCEYGLAGGEDENDRQRFRRRWDQKWHCWRYERRSEDGSWERVWPPEAPGNRLGWHRNHRRYGLGWHRSYGGQRLGRHFGWFGRSLRELPVYPRRHHGFEPWRTYRGYDGPWPWETEEQTPDTRDDPPRPDTPDGRPHHDEQPSQDVDETSV